MAASHQFIVIARVGDMKQHRVLATASKPYLTGFGPVKRCFNLMRTFADPAQRLAVQTELDFAASYFHNERSDGHEFIKGDSKTTRSPFPFILNCLMIGTAFKPFGDTFSFQYNIENDAASMVPDNLDGITVVDISELGRIQHCFVNFTRLEPQCLWEDLCDEQESHSRKLKVTYEEALPDLWARQPPLCTPLTASQYMVGHVRKRSIKGWAALVADRLDSMPLIQIEVLAGAWPSDKWNFLERAQGATAPSPRVYRGPATLVEQAINKFVGSIFATQEFDTGLLDDVRHISSFQSTFRKYLLRPANQDRLAQHPRAAELLEFAFSGESHLSWAVLDNLNPKIIRGALDGNELKAARSISLSVDRIVYSGPEELAEALFASQRLRELYLMSRPTRTRADDMASARLFIALSSSPNFPKEGIKLIVSGACSCAAALDLWLPWKHILLAPAYPVLQLIRAMNLPRNSSGDQGDTQEAETFYLGDSLLSPERVVIGLFRCMRDTMLGLRGGVGRGNGVVTCFAFASAPTSLKRTTRLEVTTLPAEMYAVFMDPPQRSSGGGRCALRDLVPGSWTVLLEVDYVFPADDTGVKMQFKYAFVRPKRMIHVDPESQDIFTEDDIDVADAEAFLNLTVPLANKEAGLRELLSMVQSANAERPFRVDLGHGERLISKLTPSEAVRVIERGISCDPFLKKPKCS